VTIQNPDGTTATLPDGLFLTADCTEKGKFGAGGVCKECPKGALCPGGNRVWPKEGYWSPSEDAGCVAQGG
jgi:hypothetical protein